MNNTIRFSGLASGLDTQSIVKAMAQPYKNKVDTAKQDKLLLEWRKEIYKDVSSKINTFKSKYIDTMRLDTTFNKTKVAVSNPGIISMDPNVPVPPGNHTVKVEQMAKGAVVKTQSINSDKFNTDNASQTKLSDLGVAENSTVSINGKEIIKVTKDTTIEELEKAVKEKCGDTVKFTFDEKNKAFVISSGGTGANESVQLEIRKSDGMIDKDGLTALGIKSEFETVGGKEVVKAVTGQNAKVTYNGGITIESATNNIEINGLKFNITGQSMDEISISSVKDTDAIVDFAKGFVDDYNKLLEDLNKLVSADSAKGYRPLTDEQREAMSEKEIELWEKKIKDSLLRNDPVLKNITSMMRGALGKDYGKAGEKYTMLGSIGISTANWSEKGKLHLDEDKLRKAINDDGEAVAKLFTQVGKEIYGEPASGKQGSADYKPATGFQALLMSNDNKSYGQYFNDKLIDNDLRKTTDEIKKAEIKYTKIENMYYKQFTAMEKMLNSLNSQSSWLSSMGGM